MDRIVDCGSALHHALVALAGEGAVVRVDRLADPDTPGRLAEVWLAGFRLPVPADVRAYQALSLRGRGVRAVPAAAADHDPLPALRAAAAAQGACRVATDAVGGRYRDAVIVAERDTPVGWLNAGEALSAVAIAAAIARVEIVHGPASAVASAGRAVAGLRVTTPGAGRG